MKKKVTKTKTKKRICIFCFFCLLINFFVFYSLGSIWKNVTAKELEKEKLAQELITLKEEEETLKVEVSRLSDPKYIAKYAREKFFYSGKNEYIIKIK